MLNTLPGHAAVLQGRVSVRIVITSHVHFFTFLHSPICRSSNPPPHVALHGDQKPFTTETELPLSFVI